MNTLFLVIPSNMKRYSDVIRLFQSIDISNNIVVYFVNQSSEGLELQDIYEVKMCKVVEIKTGKIIPLSSARNLAIDKMLKNERKENALIMFIDDDAWFPQDTIEYLISCEIKGMVIDTIDPQNNRSFKRNKKIRFKLNTYDVCCNIISICMIVPLDILASKRLSFNENLGLGCKISQGEESLFAFQLHKEGLDFFYDNHLIFHPYKKDYNVEKFYSLAYFWALASRKISCVFVVPAMKLIIKYFISLLGVLFEPRYLGVFIAICKGFIAGINDRYGVLINGE